MALFYTILHQELLLAFRNFGKVLASFLFFVISFAIFFLLLQGQDFQVQNEFFAVVIWIVLLFLLLFSAVDFLKRDFEDGTLEQMMIIFENSEIYILAKMLANWLIYCLPAICMTFLMGKFLNFNYDFKFLYLLVLASFSINVICNFCGIISCAGNSAPLISLIALPLIIPVLLIAHLGIVEENFIFSVKVLFGLAVLFVTAGSFAAARIVKIILE